MKKCPFCAEMVQNEAVKCKHCGSSLAAVQQEKGFVSSISKEIGSVVRNPKSVFSKEYQSLNNPSLGFKMKEKMNWKDPKSVGFLILIFIVALIFFRIMIPIFKNQNQPVQWSQSNQPAAEEAKTPTQANDIFDIGQEGYLRYTTGNTQASVAVFASEQAYDEFAKASSANDKMGQMGIVLRGDLFYVEPGTKTLVIDRSGHIFGNFFYRVRILDGKKMGLSGWVTLESVSTK